MIAQRQTEAHIQHASPRYPYSPLKYQRLLRGWSQQDVVDELYKLCAASGRPDIGLNAYQVSRWEHELRKPSPLYRKHLCQLYGKNAAQLGFIAAQEVQG